MHTIDTAVGPRKVRIVSADQDRISYLIGAPDAPFEEASLGSFDASLMAGHDLDSEAGQQRFAEIVREDEEA